VSGLVHGYAVWWKLKTGKFASGFINARGEVIFESPYAVCHSFREGRARCIDGSDLVYVSPDFKEVARFANAYGYCFQKGTASVGKRGVPQSVFGRIDPDGRVAVDFLFRDVGPIDEDCFYGSPLADNPNNHVNLYSRQLKTLATDIALSARSHFATEGTVLSTDSGHLFGYRDTRGRWLIKPVYDDAQPFRSGLAAVGMREKRQFRWHFIDRKGETVLSDARWRAVCGGFSEGYAAVVRAVKGGRYATAFIDQKGGQLTDYSFGGAALPFQDGLAAVCDQQDKWGYLDRSGKLVIPHQFDRADSFHGELARVRIGDRFHYISRSGERVYSLPEFYHGELQFTLSPSD
jgi:hypothetical protein